ncbi:MAG: hypothetical protein WBP59_08150 [Ilumatobacteraceae bacterium]
MADSPDPDAREAELDAALDAEVELDIDVEAIESEERAAARRLSAIEAGRRKGGLLGAAAAGAMLALRDIYEAPPRDDDVVDVSESPGDPGDIDRDGIAGTVDDVDYWAPPPSRMGDAEPDA